MGLVTLPVSVPIKVELQMEIVLLGELKLFSHFIAFSKIKTKHIKRRLQRCYWLNYWHILISKGTSGFMSIFFQNCSRPVPLARAADGHS